jgi:hypothetical protein
VCGSSGLIVAVFALTSVTTTPACADRVCEYSAKDFGRGPGEGELVAPALWESTPQTGKWLPFPAQRSWFVFPQGLAHTDIARVLVYISAAEEPNPGSQYTLASGDSALIRQFPDPGDPSGESTGVEIHNNTCADFWVRVVLEGYAPAGRSRDAGASDAPADGTDDAATDASDANDSSDGAPE